MNEKKGYNRYTLQVKGFFRQVSHGWEKDASLTVEAALVIPFYLLILSGMVHLMLIMVFVLKVQLKIQSAVENYAMLAGVTDIISDQTEEKTPIADVVLSGILCHCMEEEEEKSGKKIGVSGCNTMLTSVDESLELADGILSYQISVPYFPFHLGKLSVIHRSRQRVWSGRSLIHSGGEQEEVVFVTKEGEVYHRKRNCSYISVSVEYRSLEQIMKSRNENGERFYACERCVGDRILSGAYLAPSYGNRYHADQKCVSLKRAVIPIPFSQIQGRRPCLKCGGEN